MTQRQSFWRKVIYIGIMVVLLIPMSWLSMPASRGREGAPQPGGTLAKLRSDYGLGQASLGEIDPASETMKLATLGLRGIATNILWQQAINYKKTENWTKFQAVLKQIARLQPNYISVWQYQAWNTSYNLSVEFDDYHDRYQWVIRGIDFLQDGLRYNKDEPRLLWDMGWFIGQKIGRADEKVQYRRLFKKDDDFHSASGRTGEQRDNWLVSKTWFRQAIDAVDFGKKVMKGKAPLIYRADPGMAQINYADGIQSDGVHGEPASRAWKDAAKDWQAYGDDSILTSYDFRIHLNDLDRRRQEADRYREQLNDMEKGLRDKIFAERFSKLTPVEQQLHEMKMQDVSEEQKDLYLQVEAKLRITPVHLAERIEKEHPEMAIEAARLGRLWVEADRRANAIDQYRSTANFEYWEARCNFEQLPEALQARELSYQAGLAFEKQDLIAARKLYEEAWPNWRKSLDAYPKIRDEGLIAEILVDYIAQYRRVLDDLSLPFPQDFILRDIVENFDREKLVIDVFVKPAEGEGSDKQPASKPTPGETPTQQKQPPTPESKPAAPQKEPQPETRQPASKSTEGAPPEPAAESASAAQDTPPNTPEKETPAPAKETPVSAEGTPPEPADSE